MRARVLLALAVLLPAFCNPGRASAQPAGAACVLIDTDFDVDDMMAIPMIIQNRRVAAIVVTEGVTRPGYGAAALARLLATPGPATPVLVLAGGSPAPDRGYAAPKWMAEVRTDMERLNGLFRTPVPPAPGTHDIASEVERAVAGCGKVSVLALGPWTSFRLYAPRLGDRIDSVIAQGRPLRSTEESEKTSFNCAYDKPACEATFPRIQALGGIFVDVPKEAAPPYSPNLAMVQALHPDGLAGSLQAALMVNPTMWAEGDAASGNKAFLWDQLAALYLLRPELFHKVAGHWEPNAPVDEVRRLWTAYTNTR